MQKETDLIDSARQVLKTKEKKRGIKPRFKKKKTPPLDTTHRKKARVNKSKENNQDSLLETFLPRGNNQHCIVIYCK